MPASCITIFRISVTLNEESNNDDLKNEETMTVTIIKIIIATVIKQ